MRSKAALLGMIVLMSLTQVFVLLPGLAAGRIDRNVRVSRMPADEPWAVVIEYADNELPGDGFIDVDGLSVKKSNYHGVLLGAQTYYYCVSPHMCSCPVCRGDIDFSAIELVYTDESPDFTLVVYTHPGVIGASITVETSALTLH